MAERLGNVLYWTGCCCSHSCGGALRVRHCRQRQGRLGGLQRHSEQRFLQALGCLVGRSGTSWPDARTYTRNNQGLKLGKSDLLLTG